MSLRKQRSAGEYQQTLAPCFEEIADLNRFVESLLIFVTPEEHSARASFFRVDLEGLVGDVEERLDRMFDRLYQADPSRDVGHGLVLAIVK